MSSSRINHVFTALPNERTLQIPVRILVNNQIIETTAIIDSGATGSFIDPGLIGLTKFPVKKLDRPVKAYNVDGTTNSKGNIIWETNVDLQFPKHRENVRLMILNLGRRQIILGMPWLKKWNPIIDWINKRISIPKSISQRDVVPPRECLPSEMDSLVPQRYIL